MQVSQVMSKQPHYISADTTVGEAARSMQEKSIGLVPVASDERLIGIVTDRDLALRSLTDGISPSDKIDTVLSGKVLYCYAEDNVEDVLNNMTEQSVQRLVVLDNAEDKNLVGVVSISDIADKCGNSDSISRAIVDACKHYH